MLRSFFLRPKHSGATVYKLLKERSASTLLSKPQKVRFEDWIAYATLLKPVFTTRCFGKVNLI
jgi:hypothetical protein